MSDLDRATKLLRHALELHEHGREYSWQARYPVREALKILQQHQKEQEQRYEQRSSDRAS